MNFKKTTLKDVHNKLINKEISITDLVEDVLKTSEKEMKSNFLITLCKEEALKKAKELEKNIDKENILYGIPFIHKDNISTKGILTTAGSKILSNYVPSFNATIAEKFLESNSIMIGKAALDELSMGGTGLFSFNGEVRNPYDSNRIVGGSSSGSAYAVAKGIVPFATGGDTGDSIRKPASLNGIVGFKPTYGSISRYGAIPYAPSLDHLGFFTNNVEDLTYLCEATYAKDDKDFTSIDNRDEFVKNINNLDKKIKFGYIKHIEKYLDGQLKKDYEKLYEILKKEGHEVLELDFDKKLLHAVPATYMMISFAEGVSTHYNLDGIKFGLRAEGKDYREIIKNSRTQGFGDTVKRRFIIGSYQLKSKNQEILLAKSKKVRRLIVETLDKLYEQVDILIIPPTFKPAPTVNNVYGVDVEQKDDNEGSFVEDVLILANFNGMPSITIPFTTQDNMPIGINLNAKPKKDLKVLQAAKFLEEIISKNFRQVGDLIE
ncbi:amidase family protein [Spiroplasma floricola]|uniref:Aspartyl/glutamyl-tRNA amidotransferase subunit A n=1 Tax=Spiroplasma floricola 23-6 TaxID=1336749 RepID=A0A2K8SCX9_9MOLU|nr:amidase family protein [Spiroplasma floricola]AUB31175.1 aspartyl/glutamyl-tRNA amidotransferase subunit A [Spiroplasma floricola 23-6]